LHGTNEGSLHGTQLDCSRLPERAGVQASGTDVAQAHGSDGREMRGTGWVDESSDEVAVSANALDSILALCVPFQLAMVGDTEIFVFFNNLRREAT
jgi:hypothetical protein